MNFIKNYSNRIDFNSFGKYYRYEFFLGNSKLFIELGKIAKQSNFSLWIKSNETIILTTLCISELNKDLDFMPLTCDYIEKTYSIGKIPSGYIKKESKQTDKEILISRAIDRSIRPMLKWELLNCELQIISILLSYDFSIDTEIISICSSSILLYLSNLFLNFNPVIALKLFFFNNKYLLLNVPNKNSDDFLFNSLITISKDNIVMIEFFGFEINPNIFLNSLLLIKNYSNSFDKFCNLIKSKQHFFFDDNFFFIFLIDNYLLENIIIKNKIINVFKIKNKNERNKNLIFFDSTVMFDLKEFLLDIYFELSSELLKEYKKQINKIKKGIFRNLIFRLKTRFDSRKTYFIRDIDIENGIIYRAHGSSLFSRGETQALVTVTLGSEKDEQKIEDLEGDEYKKLILHYNFFSFSVGEIRFNKFSSRREIGHGNLAEKTILKVLDIKNLKNTIRIVSEILESNGSSSMATVCGTSLALRNAGINLLRDVAGLTIGVIQENNKNIILCDIIGDEDHYGDMDFKICATKKGIVSIQMDVKKKGISIKLLEEIVYESKIGLSFIINKMNKYFLKNNNFTSLHSPTIIEVKVNTLKIKDIIGIGGKNIKNIINKTNVDIDIFDDGIIKILGKNENNLNKALNYIIKIITNFERHKIYNCKIKKILKYDLSVEIYEGVFGYCLFSEFLSENIDKINDFINFNDVFFFTIINTEDDKIKLSRIKNLDFNCDFKYINFY